MKLLGIRYNQSIPEAHEELLKAPREPLDNSMEWIEVKLKKSSYSKNVSSYLMELDNVPLTTDAPVAICRPITGEAWDLCLKVLVPGFEEPMLVFIDNKSMDENNDSSQKEIYDKVAKKRESGQEIVAADIYDNGTQYFKMKSVLGDRKFIYLYTTTHPIDSFYFENAIQLGRADSYFFFGTTKQHLSDC